MVIFCKRALRKRTVENNAVNGYPLFGFLMHEFVHKKVISFEELGMEPEFSHHDEKFYDETRELTARLLKDLDLPPSEEPIDVAEH